MHEGPHLFVGFSFHQSSTGGDASILQCATSVASYRGVWVVMGDDHFAHSSPHQGFRARGCSTKVVARLKRYIGG